MPLRYLAILVLLLPTLRGTGLLHDAGIPADCALPVCCEVIEVDSCCGEEIVIEQVCTMAVDTCTCVSNPTDLPEPPPVPVVPLTLSELIQRIPETSELIVWTTPRDHPLEYEHSQTKEIHNSTHNQIQSALGVWRI